MDRAIEEGYLLPYYTYQARTVRTGNEAGIEVKRNEIDWNILTDEDKEFPGLRLENVCYQLSEFIESWELVNKFVVGHSAFHGP